jgi:2-alkyl-3-oxoalkanoate reductase
VPRAVGVRRHLQQLSGFFLKARGVWPTSPTDWRSTCAGVALSAQMYAEFESRLEWTEPLECVGLRYGFFYGPRTWFNPDGAAADQVRRQEMPIVGEGIKASGPGSTSRTWPRQPRRPSQLLPGFRSLSTTTPPPVVHWLPEFARFLRAPPPPRITEQQARDASGEDAVHYDTKLDGASNEKAKKTFAFAP